MPETTGVEAPQAGATTQPQAGTSSSGQQPGAQTSAAAASGTDGQDTATLVRERDEARREAAKHRTELQRFQQAQDAQQKTLEQRLADLEKANNELVERESETRVEAAIVAAATRLGFRNPDLAAPIIRSRVVVEDGRAKNVDQLLKELISKDPYLARSAPDLGGGNRGSGPQGTDMNALIRRAAGRPG